MNETGLLPPPDLDAEPKKIVLDYPGDGPNPAQVRMHNLIPYVDEVLFGGAAGGGKSDLLLAYALRVCLEWPGANVLLMRRTFPELNLLGGIAQRLKARVPPELATYHEAKHVWSFENGSHIQLGHLNRGDADLTNYLGGEYALIGIDQAEDFSEHQWLMLSSRLRVGGELGTRMRAAGFRPLLLLTANPGGVSHMALYNRFVKPFPEGNVLFRDTPDEEQPDPKVRAYVPARVFDNLKNVGEEYLRQLNALPPEQRRAYRDGDWTAMVGQRFEEFRRDLHVVTPEEAPIPFGAKRVVAVDYGWEHPMSVTWCALVNEVKGIYLEDPALVVYREIQKKHLTPPQQARLLLSMHDTDEWPDGITAVIDPATWARDARRQHAKTGGSSAGGISPDAPPPGSIADDYRREGVPVRKADNRRLESVALISDLLRVRDDGLPRLFFYSTCRGVTTLIPSLVRDPARPEDVLKVNGDDAWDSFRYAAMALKAPLVIADNVTDLSTVRGRTGRNPMAGVAGLGAGIAGMKSRRW